MIILQLGKVLNPLIIHSFWQHVSDAQGFLHGNFFMMHFMVHNLQDEIRIRIKITNVQEGITKIIQELIVIVFIIKLLIIIEWMIVDFFKKLHFLMI